VSTELTVLEHISDQVMEVRPLATGFSAETPGHFFLRSRVNGVLVETESGTY
jgi:hypothetical protein